MTASVDFNNKMMGDDRQLRIKAAFFNNLEGDPVLEFTGEDHLVEIEINEIVNSEENITMGSVCSSELKLKLINVPARDDYDLMIIKLEAGILLDSGDVEYIKLGTYYVHEINTDNDYAQLEITAYDGMCLLDKEYITDIVEFPVSVEDVVNEVASMAGIALSNKNDYKGYQIDMIPECSLRQIVSYIAGMLGCYARFDRDGQLAFEWYEETSHHIPLRNQYLNGFSKNMDKAVTVTGIITGNENASCSRGIGSAGTVINFENPFIDEIVIEDIWRERIAEVKEETIVVRYSGEPDLDNAVVASYVDGRWTTGTVSNLHIGDILTINEAAGWDDAPEAVVVDEILENGMVLVNMDGSKADVTESAEATFVRNTQWLYDKSLAIDSEEGTLFSVVEASGWDDAPDFLRLSGLNNDKRELMLLDVKGEVLDIPQGAVCTLSYSRSDEYKLSFLPSEVKWRGNLSVRAGNVIEVEDRAGVYHKILVMSQSIKLGAGLEMTCKCEGNIENDSSFSSSMSPTSQKITKMYSDLQQAISDATAKITGQNGGVVSFGFNEAGEPNEVFIKCIDEQTGKEGVWRWNSNGLGYSKNGLSGPYELAMTSDGKILGSLIQANTISGEAINIESFVNKYNTDAKKENWISASHIRFEADSLKELISASVSSIGGRNLITNSTGVIGPMEGWEIEGDTNVVSDNSAEYTDILVSQRALIIGDVEQSGVISKKVDVIKGEMHTLSFKYKKKITDFKIYIDNTVLYDSDKEETTDNEWVTVSGCSFTPEGSSVSLKIETVRGQAVIGDLMICVGIGNTWTQADGEVIGTNVILTKDRITIDDEADDASSKEISSELSNVGVRVIEKDSNGEKTEIASYTDKGAYTKEVVSEGQVSAGNLKMIPIPELSACMFVLNNKKQEGGN